MVATYGVNVQGLIRMTEKYHIGVNKYLKKLSAIVMLHSCSQTQVLRKPRS